MATRRSKQNKSTNKQASVDPQPVRFSDPSKDTSSKKRKRKGHSGERDDFTETYAPIQPTDAPPHQDIPTKETLEHPDPYADDEPVPVAIRGSVPRDVTPEPTDEPPVSPPMLPSQPTPDLPPHTVLQQLSPPTPSLSHHSTLSPNPDPKTDSPPISRSPPAPVRPSITPEIRTLLEKLKTSQIQNQIEAEAFRIYSARKNSTGREISSEQEKINDWAEAERTVFTELIQSIRTVCFSLPSDSLKTGAHLSSSTPLDEVKKIFEAEKTALVDLSA